MALLQKVINIRIVGVASHIYVYKVAYILNKLKMQVSIGYIAVDSHLYEKTISL